MHRKHTPAARAHAPADSEFPRPRARRCPELSIAKTAAVRARVSGDELDAFDLLIRVYPPAPLRSSHGGVIAQHLGALALGDSIEVRVPIGEIECLGGRRPL